MPTEDKPDLFGALLAGLKHANPNVRAAAARALGKTARPEAVEPLIETLSDRVHFVHTQAARGLAGIGAPAAGALLALIQSPPFEGAEKRAGAALREICDPNAVDMLCAALTYPEAQARHHAAQALGLIRDPAAIPALSQAAQHPDPATRRQAAIALGRIGHPGGVQALTALLGDEDDAIRITAARALGQTRSEQAILPLLTLLEDENPQVRQTAAAALKQIPASHSLDELITTLTGTRNAWMRAALAEILGEIGEPKAKEVLEELVQEEGDLQTRLNAAQSLVKLGDPRGKAMILRTLNAPNAHTRLLAAIALGNTGDARAVGPILESPFGAAASLGTPEKKTLRQRGVAALAHVGAAAIPALVQALASPNAGVRKMASDALLEIGAPAVGPLCEALRSRNPKLRQQAIPLLGQIGDPGALPALTGILRRAVRAPYLPRILLAALYDPTANERKLAADALREIAAAESTTALLETARFDFDPDVRQHAEQALAAIGDAESVLRLAEPNVIGPVYWGTVSLAGLLAGGVVVAVVLRWLGAGEWGLLAGLVFGAVYGGGSGFVGQKRAVRGALLGSAAALGVGGMATLIGAGSAVWGLVAAGLPVIGAASGWQRLSLPHRLAGLFAGMIAGFVAAGAGVLLLGGVS